MANTQYIGPPGLPPELAHLKGVTQGHQIVPLGQTKIVLGSLPGRGKSTLIHGSPKTFVLDLENGGATVKKPLAGRFGPSRLADGSLYTPRIPEYLSVVETLCRLKKQNKVQIDTIAIDTVDSWFNLHGLELCEERNVGTLGDYGPHGEGYQKRTAFFQKMMMDISKAGFGWIAVCHMCPKTVRAKTGDVQVYGYVLSDSPANWLFGNCYHQLFVDDQEISVTETRKLPNGNTYEAPVGTKRRRVIVSKPGGLKFKPGLLEEVKCRVPLADEVEISEDNGWADLETAYNEACKTLQNGVTNG